MDGDVYTIEEVIEKLRIPRKDMLMKAVDNNEFVFPSVKIGKLYLFPKAPIDAFLRGERDTKTGWWKKPRKYPTKTRRARWDPANTVYLNYPCPRELNDKFDKVIEMINETLPQKLPKGDFIRLALEEFIERRPEYLDPEDIEE